MNRFRISTPEGTRDLLFSSCRALRQTENAVRDALEAKGYTFLSAEVAEVPSTTVDLTDEDAIEKMTKLLEMLDDNDDVQEVYHNWNMPEEEDED